MITAWHWFDFICPFCYVAHGRNDVLRRAGIALVQMPFEIHPEIPKVGIAIGERSGPLYGRLEQEARDAELPLRWPSRLPNSRYALAVAEWVRWYHAEGFTALHDQLFLAHFALGEDIGNVDLVDFYATKAGADISLVHQAMSDGSAVAALEESESAARRVGVAGTPAWLIGNHLVNGLQPQALFEKIARELKRDNEPQGNED